jgi:hypothetical protein
MDEDKYSFNRLPDEYYYDFFSEGPKGKIKKVVRYRLIEEHPNKVYNLGFGDWDESQEDVNDKIATNNRDKQKVLATVADTIIDFTTHHPDSLVFAQGSTSARTRLYQMGIASFWQEINSLFIVIAYRNNDWEPFEKGKNYEAFLIKRK